MFKSWALGEAVAIYLLLLIVWRAISAKPKQARAKRRAAR